MAFETLIIEYSGRCMLRQPTDPEPYDENRGTSGYTFAFANEPPLNRVIYFHESPDFPVRSHCPPIGVQVDRAYIQKLDGFTQIEALRGAKFNLLGDPKLENRNWALTRPGYEPIVPFHLLITAADELLEIERLDVLDPDHPDLPVWKLPLDSIEKKGARGLAFEPATVGEATGTYDGYIIAKQRCEVLKRALRELEEQQRQSGEEGGDDPGKVILQARIFELEIGIRDAEAGKPNRRTSVRPLIERFGYSISGNPGILRGDVGLLHGELDLSADGPWRIDFWIGGWDCDALCAFTKGTLQIPYVAPPAEPSAKEQQ